MSIHGGMTAVLRLDQAIHGQTQPMSSELDHMRLIEVVESGMYIGGVDRNRRTRFDCS